MKVLWLINILLPAQCRRLNVPEIPVGGWIEGLMMGLSGSDIHITVCSLSPMVSQPDHFSEGNVDYLIIPDEPTRLQQHFREAIQSLSPDLVHIYGTEMYHSLEMMEVCDPQKTMVQIQGLTRCITNNYFLGIPHHYRGLRHRIKSRLPASISAGNMYRQYRNFQKAAQRESKILFLSRHVLGHTSWDRAHTAQMAPNASYYDFPETLRNSFYTGQWSRETCRPYSIFVSQATLPIKGVHMLIQALPGLVKDFPDTHLYIGGYVPQYSASIPLGRPIGYIYEYYGYLCTLIRKLGLREHVSFLGSLSEEQMKEQYLLSHVFVSASSIENESNSLSEAKMLGVPCVASYVGGVTDRIAHGSDGFFYPYEEWEMLRYYIGRIFSNDTLASSLSKNAAIAARRLNAPDVAAEQIKNIYRQVLDTARGYN